MSAICSKDQTSFALKKAQEKAEGTITFVGASESSGIPGFSMLSAVDEADEIDGVDGGVTLTRLESLDSVIGVEGGVIDLGVDEVSEGPGVGGRDGLESLSSSVSGSR